MNHYLFTDKNQNLYLDFVNFGNYFRFFVVSSLTHVEFLGIRPNFKIINKFFKTSNNPINQRRTLHRYQYHLLLKGTFLNVACCANFGILFDT